MSSTKIALMTVLLASGVVACSGSSDSGTGQIALPSQGAAAHRADGGRGPGRGDDLDDQDDMDDQDEHRSDAGKRGSDDDQGEKGDDPGDDDSRRADGGRAHSDDGHEMD